MENRLLITRPWDKVRKVVDMTIKGQHDRSLTVMNVLCILTVSRSIS